MAEVDTPHEMRARPGSGHLADIGWVVRVTYNSWRDDRTIRLGAGLAYYGLFAIAPVVTIGLALVRVVFTGSQVQSFVQERLDELVGTVGPDVAAKLSSQLASNDTQASLGVIGAASLVVTASLFFIALQDALNVIWDVPVQPGLRSTIRRRLFSLVVVVSAAGVLIAGLVVQSVNNLFDTLLPEGVEALTLLSDLVGTVSSWAVLGGAVTLVFRFIPAARVPWRVAIVGGVVTAALLTIGTVAIGWYLRNFAVQSVGNVAWALVLVLLWVYYEAQILLAGAQLTKVLSQTMFSQSTANRSTTKTRVSPGAITPPAPRSP